MVNKFLKAAKGFACDKLIVSFHWIFSYTNYLYFEVGVNLEKMVRIEGNLNSLNAIVPPLLFGR